MDSGFDTEMSCHSLQIISSQLLKLELVLLRPAPVSVEAEQAGGRLVHEAAHTGGCHRIVIIQCQAHLHQQTEVVTGDVGVRTSDDLSLLEPLLTNWTQNAERLHRVLGVEDVVDDALEVKGVIGVGHQLGRVGTGHVEGVGKLLVILRVTEHLKQAVLVPDVFELVVLCAHAAPLDVLDGSGLRLTVEI